MEFEIEHYTSDIKIILLQRFMNAYYDEEYPSHSEIIDTLKNCSRKILKKSVIFYVSLFTN